LERCRSLIEQKIIAILEKVLGKQHIVPESRVVDDLGCCSIVDGMEIVLLLQNEFRINLLIQDCHEIVTVRDLVNKIESLIKKPYSIHLWE